MAFVNTIRGGPPTYLTDLQNYSSGAYNTYTNSFNASALHAGDTYSQQTRLFSTTFPNNTTYTHSWPASYVCPNGVWGYNRLAFGNYLGGAQSITPRQIKNIATLTHNQTSSISGHLDGFDVLIDMFVTSASGDTSAGALVAEIGVFTHTPSSAWSYARAATQRADMTVSGRTWKVASYPTNPQGVPYILIQPSDQSDVLSGSIDLKAMLANLVSQGILTGNEWFNGYGFGTEPTQGAGSLLVSQFSVSYA